MNFSMEAFVQDLEQQMDKTFTHAVREFSGLRTGKASPNLVNEIPVEVYGGTSRMKDIAGISAPEPRLLVIHPWDPSIVDDVSKAVSRANIGITPIKDGKIVRIPIPELSDERREEMKKLANKMAEDNRISIRNLRRDANDKIKKLHKDSSITEDMRHATEKRVQETTDRFIGRIDEALKKKEEELESM